MDAWKLQDAKARFSEVVDRARSLGYSPGVALDDGLATVWSDLRA